MKVIGGTQDKEVFKIIIKCEHCEVEQVITTKVPNSYYELMPNMFCIFCRKNRDGKE